MTGGVDLFLRDFLHLINKSNFKTSSYNAIIYGAEEAGVQLLRSLKKNNFNNIACFIDDNKDLWGCYISGIPIKSPESLDASKDISDTIFLAIPSPQNLNIKLFFKKTN